MTPYNLWAMSDFDLMVLRDRAHAELKSLNYRYSIIDSHAVDLSHRIRKCPMTPDDRNKAIARHKTYCKLLDELAQRIAAQRSFVQSLDNEYSHRNPPRWTRADLAQIERMR